MTNGYDNEISFIENLDNKKFEELNLLLQEVIKYLYPDIKPKDIIKARKYGRYAKTDIVVSVRNKKRGISIKYGYKNSVHTEPLNKFEKYLIKNNVKSEIIDLFYRYIYSDGTNNNTGNKRIPNSEYVDINQSDIKQINFELKRLKEKLIRRFLIETDIKYLIKPEIFIHGEPKDFIWVTASEIEKYLNNTEIETTSVHTGKLYIQCWDKNIKRNEKYEYRRNYIQVKWFSLYDDMITIMSKRYKE